METETAEIAVIKAATGVAAVVTATGKCIKQLARIAGKSAKFLSNRLPESLFTAGTAIRSTESLGNTKRLSGKAGL